MLQNVLRLLFFGLLLAMLTVLIHSSPTDEVLPEGADAASQMELLQTVTGSTGSELQAPTTPYLTGFRELQNKEAVCIACMGAGYVLFSLGA